MLALAPAGCGGGHAARPAPAPTPAQRAGGDRAPSDRELIQAVLDRRARALQRGAAGAYAATAATAARADDRTAARRARPLGLRDVRLLLGSLELHGRRARADVVTAWRVRGVRGSFRTDQRVVLRRTGGGWRIARTLARRGLAPWQVADYVRRREPHFVVLAPRDVDIDAAGLPATLQEGYARFAAALPRAPLRRRYLVVVAPTAGAAEQLTLDIDGVETLAAVSDTSVRETGPAQRVTQVLSQRLLVVWPAFSGLGVDERRRVVAHELTHLVLASATSGRTPSWLVEGIALYVSGDRRSDQVTAILRGLAGAEGAAARPALSLRRLSAPDAIARLSGARQAGAYAYASAAAFAIADRYGRRALLRLYDAFDDARLRGPPGPALTSRALRRVIGEGLAGFERDLRAGLS
ncbi:MAG: hypothetical protein QOK21_244 [Solirubrobacteraceae bacterium]|nr:hypothetical protein [Solirubrobacteraceae bacterium]